MATNKEKSLSPTEAIQAFFDYYSPQEAQIMLWKWLTATVTGGYESQSQTEKENLVTFYEKLDELIGGLKGSGTSE